MTVSLSCFAGVGAQFFDNSGVPLSGGLIYSYAAGTTTPAVTYTSSSGANAHTNPIVLNSAGRVATGEIWLDASTTYKFVLQTSAPVTIATYDNVPGVASSADLAAFIANLANASDPTKGDALVGFRQSNANGNLANSVNRTVHTKLQEFISIKDFGAVGDGVTNDTDAIQNALSQAFKKTVIFPSGQYLINSLEVTQQFTTIFSEGAELVLNSAGAYTHALKLSTNFLTITGALIFNGGLYSNYDSTLWVKGGYGRYDNITFRECKLAIRIGENGVNQASLSEMAFGKCVTNGCRNAIEMYGLFSVANFTDCILVGGENAAWNGQDVTTIKNYGGRIFAENCYLYGAQTDAYPIIELNQAVDAGTYYTGYLYLNNIDSEAYGKPFLWVTNLSATNQAADSGGVVISNSRIDFYLYSLLSPQPDFFRFNNSFTGKFATINNQIRFTQPLNKRPFALGAKTQAQINFNDMYREGQYYGTNAASYPGLPPQTPFQVVLNVTRNAAFTAGSGGVSQPLIYDTIQTGVNGNRLTLADSYSTSTGKFTVPTGGLSSILIVATYTMTGGLGAAPTCFVQHVSSSGGFTRTMSKNVLSAVAGEATAMIAEAAAGDEITFQVYTDNAGAALNVGAAYNNQMAISAYITTPNG